MPKKKKKKNSIRFYEPVPETDMARVTATVAAFNSGRTSENGFNAISIATPYRRYYALWRIFADERPPLFIRTLADTFVMAAGKAMDLLKYCKVTLKWMDNTFFIPYYEQTYDTLPFGKYRGKRIAEVYYIDPNYVLWMANRFEPEKKKLQAIQDAAVQAVQENYQDEPHVEAQVAVLIANQAADNDYKVTVEQVRRQLAEEYPLAAVPFDDYVEKSDVLEPAQAQQPVTVSPARIRRMESRSIHTANGIEVKIPTELLSSDNEVEFLHSDDGSISLLIKNVI